MPSQPTISRQAVIIIHGIGEQHPMDTLRSFAEAVAPPNQDPKKPPFFSKPDRFSDSFELRRLTAHAQENTFKTDYFEFYWAHLMQGTEIRDILWWIWTMFFRWPWTIPSRLRWIFWVFWGTILIALGLVIRFNDLITYLPVCLQSLLETQWIKTLTPYFFAAISLIFNGILLNYLGDAIRYFTPRPRNVPEREKIRKAGIALIRRLHEAKNSHGNNLYDRIIIVGHSLGSVIAYDLIYLYWNEINTKLMLEVAEIDKAEKAANEFAAHRIDLDTYRQSQFDFWLSQYRTEHSWRISDLITAGSPLAFADLHLAENAKKLAIKQKQREFPTCPPTPERPTSKQLENLKDKTKEYWFSYPASDNGSKRTLHHASPFAMTRWSNLSFKRDYVGGTITCFGPGVDNKEFIPKSHSRLCSIKLPYKRFFPFQSHTHYWDKEETASLKHLQSKMQLTFSLLGISGDQNDTEEY